MINLLLTVVRWLFGRHCGIADLKLENLALRHHWVVLSRRARRPKIRAWDRLFWIALKVLWSGWRQATVIVQPKTVVAWHRRGFRMFWRWKSRGRAGRPGINRELVSLIRRMWAANPTWGSPRIRAELKKLGLEVAMSTVRRYRPTCRRPSSESWKSFLTNHASGIAAMDFFVVPTESFGRVYVLLIVRHERRAVVHWNVTESPSTAWTAQQVVEAFPLDRAPRYLVRDRDGIYGTRFVRRVRSLGIEEKVIAPMSPWQNPIVERLIGSIRRECLDRVIVLNDRHLRKLLADYGEYYHRIYLTDRWDRMHRLLGRSSHPSAGRWWSFRWLEDSIIAMGGKRPDVQPAPHGQRRGGRYLSCDQEEAQIF